MKMTNDDMNNTTEEKRPTELGFPEDGGDEITKENTELTRSNEVVANQEELKRSRQQEQQETAAEGIPRDGGLLDRIGSCFSGENQPKVNPSSGVATNFPSTDPEVRDPALVMPPPQLRRSDQFPGAVAVQGSNPNFNEDVEVESASDQASEGLIEAELVEHPDEPKVYATAEIAPPDNRRWYLIGSVIVLVVVVVILATMLTRRGASTTETIPVVNTSFVHSLQIGGTLIGSAAGDQFGAPLVLNDDGTILAIGSRKANMVGENSGLVAVYQVVPVGTLQHGIDSIGVEIEYRQAKTEWKRHGNVLWGEAAGDEFAFSAMAINKEGTRLAVGAPYRDVTVTSEDGADIVWTDAGNVRVFDYDNTTNTWGQVGPSINGPANGTVFGRGLAMSSDGKIVAGASYESSENGIYTGNVMVFREVHENGKVTWVPMGRVLVGRAAGDRFGRSIDMSADGMRLVIGASQFIDHNTSAGPGYAQVYEFDGNDWVQLGQDLWGLKHGDVYGREVEISKEGSVIAIGANMATVKNMTLAGMAQVFEYDEASNSWVQLGATLEASAESDDFGLSIALTADGYRIAVGATQKTTGAGYVRVLDYNPATLSWDELSSQPLRGDVELEKFGADVQLSADGTVLAVGVPAGGLNGEESGHVKVLDLRRL